MKKAILVVTCVAALSFTTAGAFAQSSTGPAAQQDTMSKDKMGKEDSMKKEGMGTTGMKSDMNKDGMKKDMSKDGSSNADAMKKKGN